MQSWHIKFDGSKNCMRTDEFIYRVRSLTKQNLNNEFQLLCDHLYLLFTGKASDWYWKFHRTHSNFTWEIFCLEFKRRFEKIETDYDIWEKIRKRRQGDNEPFDDFQCSIEDLVDRLQNGIPENELVDLLIRNAKPIVHHELLHLNVSNRSQLRREIRKHEQFYNDIKTFKPRAVRSYVTELSVPSDSEQLSDDAHVSENLSEIQRHTAKTVQVCWNCDKPGHRFDDCVGPRKIFCFGCGAKEIFKPMCPKCNPSGNGMCQPTPSRHILRTY